MIWYENLKSISKNFSDEEYDVLLSSGEQVTSALLSARFLEKNIQAGQCSRGKFQLSLKVSIRIAGYYP